MKVSDPRDDPVFTIRLSFLVLEDTRALFPFSSRLAIRNIRLINRPKLERKSGKTRARFIRIWLSYDESEPSCQNARHVSSYFQGAQGEPGTKGERGDPGLPVSPMLHQVFIHRRI